MLQISLLRQQPELVKQRIAFKHFGRPDLVDDILKIDEERRQIQSRSDALLGTLNASAKDIGKLMGSGQKEAAEALKQEVAKAKASLEPLKEQLQSLEQQQHQLLVQLPNLPHASVPPGKTPEENEVVREQGPANTPSGAAKPHWELTQEYRLVDFELGNKITGSGFPVYTGQGARLQRALISYFLDFNTRAGYYEVLPPLLVNEASGFGTGQLPDKEGQMYHVGEDNLYLIPTSEVPVTNLFRDEQLKATELPRKLTAYSSCFRREAGSYGKEVRGLNRLHQFEKVEIVQLTLPEKSYEALEGMVLHVEALVKSLELPYRILRLCGGDMSFASALTYDFEVWSAAQQRWLEVSSVSNFETFQSNRLKCRYKSEEGKSVLVHTLNGSSLALPRIVAALLENHQQENHIALPEVLHSYFGSSRITLP